MQFLAILNLQLCSYLSLGCLFPVQTVDTGWPADTWCTRMGNDPTCGMFKDLVLESPSHCLKFCSHAHELWCETSLLAFHVGLPLIYLLRSISLVTAQERYAFIQWGGTLSSCSPLLDTLDIPWMYWLLRRQIIVIDIFSFTVATITLWCIWKSCCPHILVFYLVRLIPPWRLQCMVVWAFSHLKETWDASVGSKQQRKEREGFSDELLTSLQIFCWRYYWFRRIWSSWLPPPDSRGTIDKAVFWGEIIIANIIFCTVASIYFVVYLEKLLPSHSTLWPGETHSTLVEERCAFFTSWWHYWLLLVCLSGTLLGSTL